MLKHSLRQHCGFTLTELMIAIVINAIIFGGLISVFIANITHYRATINTNRLNQQMQSAMDMMTTDIRRHGYWANAQVDVGTHATNNPFQAAGADLTVSGSCILVSYDADKDGTLHALDVNADDEHYGYRITNQAIQARPPGAAYDCAAAVSAWENITDTRVISITALTFTLTTKTITTGPSTRGLQMRSLDISMTGQLANNATVTKTLTQHVRIRNDKFIP